MLPPPEVPFSLEHLERLLADLGFRTRRIRAAGNAADTVRLRAGSLVQRPDGVAVYLGQPDGRDRWLKGDVYVSFQTAAGDLILAVDPDPDFHPTDEARPNWFRNLFERIRDELFALLAMSVLVNLLALSTSLYIMVVYSTVIPSGNTKTTWGLALVASVAVIGGWALRVGRERVLSRLGSWAGTRIGEATMRKMLSLPLDALTKPEARYGLLHNRLTIRPRGGQPNHQLLDAAGIERVLVETFGLPVEPSWRPLFDRAVAMGGG